MRRIAFIFAALAAVTAAAGEVSVLNHNPAPVAEAPACNDCAQSAAIIMARRGRLVHTGCGCVEGIGFSTRSADAAVSNCCYWGKRRPRDIGVARGPRGWYAVVWYH